MARLGPEGLGEESVETESFPRSFGRNPKGLEPSQWGCVLGLDRSEAQRPGGEGLRE